MKSDKIIIVRKSNFVDKILMCPIRSPASDGLLTLFGSTSDMKLSQNLYLTLIEVRHPMARLVSAYRHVFERQQGYEDQLIKVASMREVGISSGDIGVLTEVLQMIHFTFKTPLRHYAKQAPKENWDTFA